MKRLKITILFLIVLMAIFAVAGCAKSITDDTNLREAGRYRVDFNAMGGLMGNYAVRAQYAEPQSLLLEPGTSPEFERPICGGHKLIGWFLGESNSGGGVVYGNEWNFKTSRMPEHDITLYAKWEVLPTFVIVYGEGNSESKSYNVNAEGKMFSSFIAPDWEGYTLLNYYADEDLTIPFDFSVPHNNNKGKKQVKIYTDWLEGEYKLIRKAEDFTALPTSQFYLMNDIDFEGTNAWKLFSSFTGKLIGNGYTIKNINFSTNSAQGEQGLFGALSGAEIRDVTFENITYTLTIGQKRTFFIGLLGGSIKNTTLTNITIINSNIVIETNPLLIAAKEATVYTARVSGTKLPATVIVENCDFAGITVTNNGLNEGGLIFVE